MGLLPTDNSNTTLSSMPSPLSTLFASPNEPSSHYSLNFQDQRNSSQQFDPGQNSSYLDMKPTLFDELLTPPSSTYTPVNNNNSSTSINSLMNASYPGTTNDSISSSPYTNHQNTAPFPY